MSFRGWAVNFSPLRSRLLPEGRPGGSPMAVTTDTCAAWLAQAQINPQRLTSAQHLLLQAAFRFRQQQGADYYSTRILGHFLLHCGTGLKVAQLARLLHISRPT